MQSNDYGGGEILKSVGVYVCVWVSEYSVIKWLQRESETKSEKLTVGSACVVVRCGESDWVKGKCCGITKQYSTVRIV